MTVVAKTTIPDVLDYIYQRCVEVFPESIMVTDGMPPPPKEMEPDILCIGFTGVPGEPAIDNNSRETKQLNVSPDQEAYDIVCIASSWHGDDVETSSLRRVAYGMVNTVNEILMQDHTLGNLVMRARIVSDQYAQEQTIKGAVVTVRFSIRVIAATRKGAIVRGLDA